MKVVYVITRSDVMGGASVHLLDLAKGVQDLGHEVTILVGGRGLVVDRAKQRGLDCRPLEYLVREISPWVDFKGYLELRRVLSELRPDIVHLHSAKAGILGRLVAWRCAIPAVYTAHGWPFTEGVSERKRKVFAFIERAMARISNRIITVSEYDRDIAIAQKVADKKQMVVVHNGIPDDAPQPNLQRRSRTVKLIMVARFEDPKDQCALLHALSCVRGLDWRLELVGDGPRFDENKKLAEQLDLSDRVAFLGARDDVPQRLNDADVLVLVSRWEGLPLTVLEAMRAGLPVIVSNVGGVSEAVSDGKTGFLVPREGQSELVEALTKLIEDADLRRTMGAAGRSRYEVEFTFNTMLARTVDVYRDALGGVT